MKNNSFENFKTEFEYFYPGTTVELSDGCLILHGELNTWDEIVSAGYFAVKFKNKGVVNKIKLKGFIEPPMHVSSIKDNAYNKLHCDVLIIGGGIIGCAILREFSKYKVNAVLVEKEEDLALQASSRNDGCVHIGIDISHKTKKQQYLERSVKNYEKLANDLGIEYHKDGQTIAFTNNKYRYMIPLLRIRALQNKIPGMKYLNRRGILKLEPNITTEAKFAVHFPTAATICPYNMTIALAENAVQNGGRVLLNTAVLSMLMKDHEIVSVRTNRGLIYPKVVVNAAGVFSDKVAAMADDQFFSIHPRKGTNTILDKNSRSYLSKTSLTTYGLAKSHNSTHSKGGGVVPTVDGNILVGPSACETPYREDFTTDVETINELFDKHKNTMPRLSPSDIITYFTGVRAATYEEDFVVEKGRRTKNIVHAAGIQSPGITAAPAIAEDIVKFTQEVLETRFEVNENFNPIREITPSLKNLPSAERDAMIKKNPDYGQIVCRCEEISKGEIVDAIHRPIPVTTIDGIKRRVRPGMGRCQGAFCQPLVMKILASELNCKPEDINKKGEGHILLRNTKVIK